MDQLPPIEPAFSEGDGDEPLCVALELKRETSFGSIIGLERRAVRWLVTNPSERHRHFGVPNTV
jgi:hypothetical protein